MRVPKNAEEVCTAVDEDGAFGTWRDENGFLYVARYHFGPSGDVLFVIAPDGGVTAPPYED